MPRRTHIEADQVEEERVAVPSILLWMPLPPPYAGPELASQLLLQRVAPLLSSAVIENASLRTSNMQKGRFDVDGVLAFARAYERYLRALNRTDVAYLVAAASAAGCLRDAVLVETARRLGRKIVLHFRGGRYDDYYDGSPPPLQRVLRRAWGSASVAIVETPRLQRMLRNVAPHVRTEVLPNGLPEQEWPAKLAYDSRRPRILFVGHLTYPKGFNDLARVFTRVRERWPEAVLSCAGELPRPDRRLVDFLPKRLHSEYLSHRHELCEETKSFIRTTGVEYAGIVTGEEKRALFANADMFVLASYTEGFSIAVLEAMFSGLPVITTNVGGLPDVIVDGRNGLVVEPGDQEALHGAITRLIEDSTLRETIGRTNAREARERYEIDVVARRFAEILTSA